MFFIDEFPYGTGFNQAPISIRIMALTSISFQTHDKMAYHHTASAQPQLNQNAARTQRVEQVQFIE